MIALTTCLTALKTSSFGGVSVDGSVVVGMCDDGQCVDVVPKLLD